VYAKVFAQIFDSSIVEKPEVRFTFMDLLVLADPDGVVDMTHEAIARRTNRPLEIIRATIAELEAPDPQSRTPDEDGARLKRLDTHRDWGWCIINFDRFHKLASEEARRAKTRERVTKYRDKVRENPHSNAPVTQGNAPKRKKRHVDVDVDVDIDTDVEEETTSSAKADSACPGFDRFWKAWPKHFRKTGKTKCQAIWKRQGLEARTEQVLLAVKQDKGSPKWEEDGGQYVPMPSTWLNGCRWDRDETCTDEPEHEAPRDPSVPEGWVRGSDGDLHMDLENFVCPDPEYANEVMEQIRANTKTPEEEAYLEDADRRARKIEEADRLARKSANV